MTNPRIILFETVVFANHLVEELVVLRQVSSRSQKPAVSKFTLLNIKPRESFDKELWIIANIMRAQPLVMAVGWVREE